MSTESANDVMNTSMNRGILEYALSFLLANMEKDDIREGLEDNGIALEDVRAPGIGDVSMNHPRLGQYVIELLDPDNVDDELQTSWMLGADSFCSDWNDAAVFDTPEEAFRYFVDSTGGPV